MSKAQTIPQGSKLVKCRRLKLSVLCSFLVGWSSSAWAYQIKMQSLYVSSPEKHPNYLAMPLKLEPIAELRKELEAKEKLHLQNRGEAHITVITPPEFEVLKPKLSMEEINEIADKNNLTKAPFHIACLGRGQSPAKLSTYFLVVKSQALLKVRTEIGKAFKAHGGTGDFHPEHFYPHITVGFTQRDLHEADGVIKDERSCISGVSTL